MIGRLVSILLVLVTLQAIRDVSAGLPDWVTPDILDMVHDDKVRCMSEYEATQDMIDQVNEGVISTDRKLTCYMNCLFESFGVIDEDTGDFEYEMLLGFVPESLQQEGRVTLETCAAQVGADRCETVYNIATCVYARSPSLWFMV